MQKTPRLFAAPQRADESVRVIRIDERYTGCSWHFHPELQLCHVARGRGERLVGDRLCEIEPGEIVLLGSNLPHVWRYDKCDLGHIEATVIHFDASVLGNDWLNRPELRDVRLLLSRASQGLQATGLLRERLAQRIVQLAASTGLRRIIGLLELLHQMSESREMQTICGAGFQPVAAQLDVERLRRACDFITEHAHEQISRDTVADVVHMSGSGFSRFFKSHTGMTFQEFVSDVRISRACELLGSTSRSVTEIALECGFHEMTTFNRTFRKFRDTTPTSYRSMVAQLSKD
ncbi:MAG: AraC family transcriptional regulator [Planctomycetaceae bacterium]|nr:AraC family transcriptional regulator [Planctomycetaceae bacterium]